MSRALHADRMRSAYLAATLIAALAPGLSLAETRAKKEASVVVDFSADWDQETWIAAAFEQNAYHELSAYPVVAVDKHQISGAPCVDADRTCLLDRYATAGVDVIVLGRLSDGVLTFDVFDGWLRTRAGGDDIRLEEGSSLLTVRRRMLAAVAPLFESGGLLEKKAVAKSRAPADPERAWPPASLIVSALGLLIILLGAPLVVLGKRVDRATRRRSSLLLLGVAVVLLGYPLLPVQRLESLEWLLPMLGGSAWAWFALLSLRIAFPVLPGLSGIRHHDVGRMVRALAVVSTMRLWLLAAFYVLPALILLRAATVRHVDPRTIWMILVPLLGLLLHFWLLLLVDHLAHHLDARLVVGAASRSNPWHPVIKKYFMGYVRRSGLEIDGALLDRVLFLPGRTEAVATYGGGLGVARIVVDESLLETALHPLVEEPVFDEQTRGTRALDVGDLCRGLVVPDASRSSRSSPSSGWSRWSRSRRRAARRERDGERRRRRTHPLIGQNETLLGYIVPLPPEESVPLVIDDPDEYSVLKELLTAHYSAFDRGRYGEEADDTDPTQKDFLFGALLREIGAVQRRDPLLFTLTLSLNGRLAAAPGWVQATGRAIGSAYHRFLSRYPAYIADAYVALNRGFDHLIQFLHHVETGSDSVLTARADGPALARVSSEILQSVSREQPAPVDRPASRATVRERLIQLSQHGQVPLPEQSSKTGRLMFKVALSLVALMALGAATLESLAYRPIYDERMTELAKKIEETRQKGRPEDAQRE